MQSVHFGTFFISIFQNCQFVLTIDAYVNARIHIFNFFINIVEILCREFGQLAIHYYLK